jgi:type III secretory pathway component EscU
MNKLTIFSDLLNLLKQVLKSPDGFRSNPYGYATNQAGHFCIGLFLALLLPWWLVLLAYAVWEAVQVYLFKSDMKDSIEDTAFVAAGSLFPVSAIPILAIWVYGVIARLNQKAQI